MSKFEQSFEKALAATKKARKGRTTRTRDPRDEVLALVREFAARGINVEALRPVAADAGVALFGSGDRMGVSGDRMGVNLSSPLERGNAAFALERHVQSASDAEIARYLSHEKSLREAARRAALVGRYNVVAILPGDGRDRARADTVGEGRKIARALLAGHPDALRVEIWDGHAYMPWKPVATIQGTKKTKLDLILDRVQPGKQEVTLDVGDLTQEQIERVIATAKARGLHAAGHGRFILIRDLRGRAP